MNTIISIGYSKFEFPDNWTLTERRKFTALCAELHQVDNTLQRLPDGNYDEAFYRVQQRNSVHLSDKHVFEDRDSAVNYLKTLHNITTEE